MDANRSSSPQLPANAAQTRRWHHIERSANKKMKILRLLPLVLMLVVCPKAQGLLAGFGGDKVEGRVHASEKLRTPLPIAGGCFVVHLTEASGIDRKQSNTLFRFIRRFGYEPKRKTLADNEIVIVLPEVRASKLRVGDRIIITKYVAGVGEDGRLMDVYFQKIDTTTK